MNYTDGDLKYIRNGNKYTLFLDRTAVSWQEPATEGTQTVVGFAYKEVDITATHVSREEFIAGLIHTRYSVDDEISILRQKDIKPEEFESYNAFAEECKKGVSELFK
jgi:hypothetical protein